MARFNINHAVRVRVTDRGRQLIAADEYARAWLKPDAEGWIQIELWQVMSVFGPHMFNGAELVIETTIEIPGLVEASELSSISGQLRHAYGHLVNDRVGNTRQFADGLIAPAVQRLEVLAHPDHA